MKTFLGVDQFNVVRLVSSGMDASVIPTTWNGMTITPVVLTDSQAAAYEALPENRGGATFNGTSLSAMPPNPVQAAVKTATLADVIAVLTQTQQASIASAVSGKS